MTEKTKRSIAAEDLYRITLASGARISPDGSQVVYAVQRVDAKTEKKYSNLWIAAADGGTPPGRSPAGTSLTAARAGRRTGSGWRSCPTALTRRNRRRSTCIPLGGRRGAPVTNIEGEIHAFAWSPDGKRLVLSARKTDAEELEREKDEQKKKLGVVARHYKRIFSSWMAMATCRRSARTCGRWTWKAARRPRLPTTKFTTRNSPPGHPTGARWCSSPTGPSSRISPMTGTTCGRFRLRAARSVKWRREDGINHTPRFRRMESGGLLGPGWRRGRGLPQPHPVGRAAGWLRPSPQPYRPVR